MNANEAAGLAWVLGVGGGLGSIVVTAWIAFVIVDGYRRRQQIRAAADLQARVLERIGSAREFADFLGSDAGRSFLEAIAVDRHVPQTGILRTLQAGTVALVLGLGLIVVGSRTLHSSGAVDLGMLGGALGVGLLLASAFSYGAARRMGLLAGTDAPVRRAPRA